MAGMKSYWNVLSVCIFVLGVGYAAAPLFGREYIPTHDGEYHIIRIIEFSRMLESGNLFPRWASGLNSGYGVPVFQFNYPFPNYVGAALRWLTQDAVVAFQMAQGIGYILLAAGAAFWLSSLFGWVAGFLGATVSTYVPYVFVDLFVRGSIGEIWAFTFLFWTLGFAQKKRYGAFAAAYGLLILSHNILAMLFTLFLAGYFLIRDKRALPWMFGGVGVSAYFWLPALVESKYVVGLNTVNFREHFVELYELLVPSWGTEFSGTGSLGNKISFQIGVAPLLIILISIITYHKRKITVDRKLSLYMLIVVGLSVICMFPFSQFLWSALLPIQYIQYPWRLLSLFVPATAYLTAYFVHEIKNIRVGFGIAVLAVFVTFPYTRAVSYAPRDEVYYTQRANFTDGTSSLGNAFSTIWTSWIPNRATNHVELLEGDALISQVSRLATTTSFTVEATTPSKIRINTAYFPGWTLYQNGKREAIAFQAHGLIDFDIPAGTHTILARFEETPVRKVADFISIISLLWLVGSFILRARHFYYAYRHKHNTTFRRPQR